MNKLLSWLLKSKNSDCPQSEIHYEALTPVELNIEKKEVKSYIEALDFAYSRPDILNIAVDGPYGAGKSSVLNTWCNYRKKKEKSFQSLTISLADFEIRNITTSTSDNPPTLSEFNSENRIIEKSIEYSILQQILYKNKKSELPYSRIERISKVSICQILKSAALLTSTLIMIVITLFFLLPGYMNEKLSLTSFLNYPFTLPLYIRILGSTLGMTIVFGLIIKQLYHTGLLSKKITLDKVDLFKGAITTKAHSPSLLNIYIDEIVYFFDTLDYNVVIFEDLDRYNNGNIFIKLREINQIINSCLSGKKIIKFIYVVKDDLFHTIESRTKFFDFVIPIIPIMDNQNASEHLKNKLTEEEKKNHELLICISKIAVFIPDMRVMHNIMNEFRMCNKIVNNGDDLPKLLAMITYKNLCTKDYHGIDNKNGILHTFVKEYLNKKVQLIFLEKINEEIKLGNNNLNNIGKEKLTDKKSLRKELLSAYIGDKYSDILSFYINRNKFERLSLIDDEDAFLKLLEESSLEIYNSRSGGYILHIDSDEILDLRLEYNERCKVIEMKFKKEDELIRRKIESLEVEKRKINIMPISEISFKMGNKYFKEWVNENTIVNISITEDQINFIYFLLINGYLSTDYMSYRSIFMVGGLSDNDNNFIKEVMSGVSAEKTFEYNLDNVNNVIDRLEKLGVSHLENAQHPTIIKLLLNKKPSLLRENTKVQLEQHETQRILWLFKTIMKNWSIEENVEYMSFIVSESILIRKLLKHLTNDTSLDYIKDILFLILSVNENILSGIDNKDKRSLSDVIGLIISEFDSVKKQYKESVVVNIKTINACFLNLSYSNNKISRFIIRNIVENDLFHYSETNLNNIYKTFINSNNDEGDVFLLYPLTSIKALKIKALDDKVNNNIDRFINNLFVNSSDEKQVFSVLNNKEASDETIVNVISKMKFNIDNIGDIKNRKIVTLNCNPMKDINIKEDLYSLLMNENHILPSWNNFLIVLGDECFEETSSLYSWLTKNISKMPQGKLAISNNLILNRLIDSFIFSSFIKTEVLSTLLNVFDFTLLDVPESISLNVAELLVSNKKIIPTINSYLNLDKSLDEEENPERKNNTLCSLICIRPDLIIDNFDAVFYIDSEFNSIFTLRFFSCEYIPLNIKLDVINWLWNKDEMLFKENKLLSLEILNELADYFPIYDDLILPQLIKCLENGEYNRDLISKILNNLSNSVYKSFIPINKFSNINYSDSLWLLAKLLENAKFTGKVTRINDGAKIRIYAYKEPKY